MDNAENIDHILDNMFVQRAPAYQPTTGLSASATRKSSSPSPSEQQKSIVAEYNSTSSTTSSTDPTSYQTDQMPTTEVKQAVQVDEVNQASLSMDKMHITSTKTETYADIETVSF